MTAPAGAAGPARRIWPVGIWLCGLIACLVILSRTILATDMSAFLPRAASPAQQVMVEQLKDGAVSRLIVAGIGGAPPEQLAALSKAFAAALRARTELGAVNNGEEAAFERDRAYLWTNRYLLSSHVNETRFSVDGLREALRTDLDLLSGQAGLLMKGMLPADPTGEMLELIDRLDGGSRPVSRDGVWFSPDGARAMLMIETRAPAFDIDRQELTLAQMRDDFVHARETVPGGAAATLDMTGPAVFAVASRAQIKSDATRLSAIATCAVAVILVLAYRSATVLVLGLLPVASGALAGIAAVSLGFGFVHGITLGFGVTLIGEAVDYAIYLFSQSGGASPPKTTLARIWPTLRLGLLTSVVGFAAMLFSGFPGFVQLGLFTITGLIVAAAVTRFVLPELLPKGFKGTRTSRLGVLLTRWSAVAPRLRIGVTLLLAAALAILASHRGGFWEEELTSMNPVPLTAQNLDRQLRADIGAPDLRYMIVLRGPDLEAVLQASDRVGTALAPLVADGAIGGFDAPDRYLPAITVQRARQAAIPEQKALAARLKEAAADLPFRPDLFGPFLQDAAAARTAPLLSRVSLEGTSLALKLDSLLLKRAQEWVAILPLRGVRDVARVGMAAHALGEPGLDILDLKRESDALLATYLREAQTLSVFGGLGIATLLALALRAVPRARAVLAPLAAAVILTAALLTLGHQKLSIFHLFGLLLTVAVGSNYCLFFERNLEQNEDGRRVLVSVVLANLCTVIGFGVLSFSAVPILHGIGTTVAIGTFLSLFLAAILIVPRMRSDA